MKPGVPTGVIWYRLAQLLPNTPGTSALKPISEGKNIDVSMAEPAELAAKILRSYPRSLGYLKLSGSEFFEPGDDTFEGLKQEARFIDPRSMKEHASWRVNNRTYWLIRSFYDNGESSRNWLFLLRAEDSGNIRLADYTHRLRYRVGKNRSGLDENGNIQLTREFATTLGFGGWPLSVDKVSVAFGRYLIASGLWTIDERRWVLMADLSSDQIVFFNRDIPEAATFHALAVTEDGGTILQANSNGHLYFYDIASERLVLRGFDVDDELVVYDPQGYYAASPEGAQFVFLKFPGIAGYNSFQQFAPTLNRPDLIRLVLGGKTTAPDPAIVVPPRLIFAAEVAGSSGSRMAKLKVDATSSTGLSRVRVFIDGRAAEEIPLTGRNAQKELTVPLTPAARWITAVAVDASGYESVPVGRELPGATNASTSRLFAIAIGTDHYVQIPAVCGDDQKSSCDLAAARTDATRFAKSLEELQGSTYASVRVATFLDAKDLHGELIPKIREFVAAANENDTIMLFAAGHGFLDSSTGKFFLATLDSRLESLAATSIGWDELAAGFDGARARVIVFLDACHSGAAGNNGSNDDAVSTFINRRASVAIIAAAKGREESLESGEGGVFTTALVRAITTERLITDSNGNGVIELAELYGALKRRVVAATKGAQTPWIARNLMVGEAPLF